MKWSEMKKQQKPAKEMKGPPKTTRRSRKANKAARAQAGSFPGY